MELELLRKTFPRRAEKISIHSEEANSFLQHWCQSTDWRNTRAVVFLDPYGMQVEWKTIEALGCTQGVDLWILFPVGQAVNRLLTRAQPPTGAWANRLTSFFGIDDWKEAFYQKRSDLTLFGPENSIEKDADFDSIEQYFIRRLETVFAKAAKNPLPLFNSRNVPIFLLCFAAANPKGANTAVKIAQNILGK